MHRELMHYADMLGLSRPATVTSVSNRDDSQLVPRIMAAYRRSCSEMSDLGGVIWESFSKKASDVHEVLISGSVEKATHELRNAHLGNLLYGYETMHSDLVAEFTKNPTLRQGQASWVHDQLLRLVETVGAVPIHLPEVNFSDFKTRDLHPDALLNALERTLSTQLEFPHVFLAEEGLDTKRGVVSQRAVHAIYQAWRIWQVLAIVNGSSAIEIGAGLGRNAFYAIQMGVKRYSIVDLPLTNAAQAYFLGMTLGPDRIELQGEPESRNASVRIKNSEWFWRSEEPIDVAINVDFHARDGGRHREAVLAVYSTSRQGIYFDKS